MRLSDNLTNNTPSFDRHSLSRRDFLQGATFFAGALLAGCPRRASVPEPASPSLSATTSTEKKAPRTP
jgi:hypothetical protein